MIDNPPEKLTQKSLIKEVADLIKEVADKLMEANAHTTTSYSSGHHKYTLTATIDESSANAPAAHEPILIGSYDIDDKPVPNIITASNVDIAEPMIYDPKNHISSIPIDEDFTFEKFVNSQNLLVKAFNSIKSIENFALLLNEAKKIDTNIPILEESSLQMSDNWIVANNSDSPDSSPICQNIDGSYYVPMTTSSGMQIKYFINNDKRVPQGTVFYDYFGCGELFVSVPENLRIVKVHEFFPKMMNTYFLKEDAKLQSVVPAEANVNYVPHAKSIISPFNDPGQDQLGWAFNISDCFITEEVPVKVEESASPICAYYSLVSDNSVNIISPDYKFANHIPDFPSCACVARTGNINTVVPCDMYVNRQKVCPFYKPSMETILNINISPENTSTNINIQMNHFVDSSGGNVFDIINATDQSKLNQLKYPKEIDYDNAFAEATKIFDDYVSCYTNHNFSKVETDLESTVEVKSFIQTLIEA